jgi:hypothetical protein
MAGATAAAPPRLRVDAASIEGEANRAAMNFMVVSFELSFWGGSAMRPRVST